MRVNCIICLLKLSEDDRVSAIINCGHVFHFNCLSSWLEQSGGQRCECPICRCRILDTTKHMEYLGLVNKLHFSIDNNVTLAGDDADAALEKVAELEAAVKESNEELKKKNADLITLRKEVDTLKNSEKTQKRQCRQLQETNSTLQTQINLLEKSKRKLDRISVENVRLQERLATCEDVENAINQQKIDIDSLCQQYESDSNGLRRVVSMYKVTQSHYSQCIKGNGELKIRVRKLQQENANIFARCTKLEDDLSSKMAENVALQEATQALSNKAPLKADLKVRRRILHESNYMNLLGEVLDRPGGDLQWGGNGGDEANKPPLPKLSKTKHIFSSDEDDSDNSPVISRFKRVQAGFLLNERQVGNDASGSSSSSKVEKSKVVVKKRVGYNGLGGHDTEFVSSKAAVLAKKNKKKTGSRMTTAATMPKLTVATASHDVICLDSD